MYGKDAELQRMEQDRRYDYDDMWHEYNRRMDFDRRHEHERREDGRIDLVSDDEERLNLVYTCRINHRKSDLLKMVDLKNIN